MELLEITSVESSGLTLTAEAQSRAAHLGNEARKISTEVMLPQAAQLEAGANAIVDRAKQLMADGISAAAQQSAASERTSLGIGVLAALLLAASSVASIFVIARPMQHLSRAMRELAESNFGVTLPGLGRKDEIGAVAKAVENFKAKAEEKAQAEAETRYRQDQIAAQHRRAEMIKLADAFESAVGEIVKAVFSASSELEGSAGALATTAERAQETTTVVAAASEEASTNVQSVATATEELSSSVNEISRQVQESARIAVVASEIKALARQTAKATGEIGQQISAIQSATTQSVGAISHISTTIQSLSEIASTIAAAVEQQGAATLGDRAQCPAGGARHAGGLHAHHRRSARRRRNRLGFVSTPCCRAVAFARLDQAAAGGRPVPGERARGIGTGCAARKAPRSSHGTGVASDAA